MGRSADINKSIRYDIKKNDRTAIWIDLINKHIIILYHKSARILLEINENPETRLLEAK
jgi:hypothetical protein